MAPTGGFPGATGLGHGKGMVVGSLNIKSRMLHFDEIRLLVKELATHILAINKTKIDKNLHDDLVNIDGNTIKRCDRNCNGGEVAAYIKDTLFDKCTVRDDLPKFTLEAFCIEVNQLGLHLSLLLAWYRTPNEAVDNVRLLEDSFQFLYKEGNETDTQLPDY